MNLAVFHNIALSVIILWSVSIIFIIVPKKFSFFKTAALVSGIIGTVILTIYITMLWNYLQRPPMRTLGETRLWYSLFLAILGIITYLRWRYTWFYIYTLIFSILFLVLDIAKPENFSKTLMPALQSVWFVPHVVVYLLGYALLAASALVSIKGIIDLRKKRFDPKTLELADNFVYIGFTFITLGLIFGALWAKKAWGHYWTWDPKETWAFLTWAVYMLYIHFRYFNDDKHKTALWLLGTGFIILLVCWFGINYLPAAQNSIHVYSQ